MSQGHQVCRASIVEHDGGAAYDIVNVIPGAVEVGLEEGWGIYIRHFKKSFYDDIIHYLGLGTFLLYK